MSASLWADLFARFGPFLIPAVVFAVGVVFYGFLWLLTRWRDGEGTF